MLHIILTILKIIGIVLIVLLALVLLALAAVLFIPVRYRVKGEKEGETLLVRAEAFWLMHLLRIKALYPDPGRITVKLLWFTLYDSAGESKWGKVQSESRKLKKDKKKNREKSAGEERLPDNERAEEIQEKPVEYFIESGDETETETGKEKGFIERLQRKIVVFFEKMIEILRKIKMAIKNIWYTIKRLCDRIVGIRDYISYYIEVFGEEETKRAFSLCKRELRRIWKNIRPVKCRAELVIGTGEPETTGYILAVHGILYPIIGNNIIIEPDFENQILEGKISLKGRITAFVLLRAGIKIYFDKNIRYFFKRFKREEA